MTISAITLLTITASILVFKLAAMALVVVIASKALLSNHQWLPVRASSGESTGKS